MRGKKLLIQGMALALLVPLTGVMGCSDDDDGGTQPAVKAQVRVAHLSPDAPNVDVWVDGARVLQDVPFKAISPYLELDAGTYRVQVTPTGETDPKVIDQDVEVAQGTIATVAAVGKLGSISAEIYADDRAVDGDMAKVRFIHAGADAPPVDVTLLDGTKLFSDMEFKEASSYLSTPGATLDLQVRAAGTETVALSFGDVPLMNGTNYTVFAVGLLEDGSLAATVAVDAPGDGNTKIDLEAATAQVRVAHFSPDAPPVDVYVNGEAVAGLQGVAYKAVSGYLTLGAATQNVKVYAANTTTNPVIDADLTLTPNGVFTVAATGLVGSQDLEPYVLLDESSAAASNSWVRFSHLSPDAPMVDIAVKDGNTLFSDVAFRMTADYVEVPANSYDLEVRLSEGGDLVLSVDGVPLDGSRSYTVFAVGLAGGGEKPLEALLVEDATQ